jgi:hypothetical protein
LIFERKWKIVDTLFDSFGSNNGSNNHGVSTANSDTARGLGTKLTGFNNNCFTIENNGRRWIGHIQYPFCATAIEKKRKITRN